MEVLRPDTKGLNDTPWPDSVPFGQVAVVVIFVTLPPIGIVHHALKLFGAGRDIPPQAPDTPFRQERLMLFGEGEHKAAIDLGIATIKHYLVRNNSGRAQLWLERPEDWIDRRLRRMFHMPPEPIERVDVTRFVASPLSH